MIFNEFIGKKIGFIGVGVSNNPIIRKFSQEGLDVTILSKDVNLPEEFSQIKQVTGEDYLENLDRFDVIIRSPGMYYNHPKLRILHEKSIVITSETEIFFEHCPCKIIAITGSDGKTTTTNLITEILRQAGKRVFMGGNCGVPLFPLLDKLDENSIAVVELSSFQLLSMTKSPDIAVITNVSPNHLDVHGTMEEYIGAKKNIFLHQSPFSAIVLNADNEITAAFAENIRGNVYRFSLNEQVPQGAYLSGEEIFYNDTFIMNAKQIRLPGIHNIANYLAAITATFSLVEIQDIVKVAENFGGVEHRIEFIREKNGVKWYNDSIATSPTRVLAGLNAFNQKLIVIAGGYDKKIPFEPMAKTVNEKVKILILLGKTADKIENAVKSAENYGNIQIEKVQSLEEAVNLAAKLADMGDIVTLSPACASFDMYKNFEERGNKFKELVNDL